MEYLRAWPVWNSYMLQLFVFEKYRAQFFQQELNQKCCTCPGVLHQKIGGFVPCFTIMIVHKWGELLTLLINFDIRTLFRRNHKFDFLHQGLNGKNHTCRGGVEQKTIRFDPSGKILIVQMLRRTANNLDLARFFKIKLLKKCRVDFFHQNINGKPYSCKIQL